MKKTLFALLLTSSVVQAADMSGGVAALVGTNEPTNTPSVKVDPYSGQELALEKVNRELALQKAIVASLKEELQKTVTENEIKKNAIQSKYERKRIEIDTDKLGGGSGYNPNLPSMTILPPVNAITPPPVATNIAPPLAPQQAAEEKIEVQQPKVAEVAKKPVVKKEPTKPNILLGSIKFGEAKPNYLMETNDGKYTASNTVPKDAIQATPSGYYTTVKTSDAANMDSNSLSALNASIKKPGSIPQSIPLPPLTPAVQNSFGGTLPPAGMMGYPN